MMGEHTILFGPGDGLVGTVALPQVPAQGAGGIGLLLFNAGVVHRVGPHRINVRIARRLAEAGVASMRFDLAGHGDSARPSGERSFGDQAVVDIRAAMDALSAAANVRHFAIFGFCSGAYHGFAAALVDERIRGILMFDAFRYPTRKTRVVHYFRRLRQPHVMRAVAGAARRAIVGLGSGLRAGDGGTPRPEPEIGRIDFIPPKAEFAQAMKELLDRGVGIHFIYSGGSIREYNYAGQFRDAFASAGIGERIQADFLPELDHVATGLAHQEDLTRRVVSWGRQFRVASAAS